MFNQVLKVPGLNGIFFGQMFVNEKQNLFYERLTDTNASHLQLIL